MQVYNSLTDKKEFFTENKTIKWYTCGPTIYNNSHLGHARTFITFDIIRRILLHYGYNIEYVMNLTNLDDKIINKVNKIKTANDDINIIFNDFIGKMEKEFWIDMHNLNIMKPTIVTRVTDYIPKMITYIEKIIQNGFAYVKDGDVYFDTQKYEKSGMDMYPLVNPGIVANQKNGCEYNSKKRDNRDFALWKKEKEDEVSYDSPWGKGRVGWHLECSVMATDILGDKIDVHSGGIDLKYPHHQNEILQVNSYMNKSNYKWCDYFFHSGHLHINNEKMSQSLDNFILIKNFLKNCGTCDDLRMIFLTHDWTQTMNYNDDILIEAKAKNKRIKDFIDQINYDINNDFVTKVVSSVNDNDKIIKNDYIIMKNNIDTSLKDNFNTKNVVNEILTIIKKIYDYKKNELYNPTLIIEVYNYITGILKMLGLTIRDSNIDNEKQNKIIDSVITFRSNIRDNLIRGSANISKEVKKEMFNIIDEYRDVILPTLNIKVEDGVNAKWVYL